MKYLDAKNRAKYLKELERFLRRVLAALSDSAKDESAINKMIASGFAKLETIAKPDIYNKIAVEMMKIVEELRLKTYADFKKDDLSLWLARALNHIDKLRREKSYSRSRGGAIREEWE
ncbi:MAG: hypothetical protein LBU73_03635 [Helicobacteraceae bacterium]|nr:hypothetical protein [Helicobacteraceae bacterium]